MGTLQFKEYVKKRDQNFEPSVTSLMTPYLASLSRLWFTRLLIEGMCEDILQGGGRCLPWNFPNWQQLWHEFCPEKEHLLFFLAPQGWDRMVGMDMGLGEAISGSPFSYVYAYRTCVSSFVTFCARFMSEIFLVSFVFCFTSSHHTKMTGLCQYQIPKWLPSMFVFQKPWLVVPWRCMILQ